MSRFLWEEELLAVSGLAGRKSTRFEREKSGVFRTACSSVAGTQAGSEEG